MKKILYILVIIHVVIATIANADTSLDAETLVLSMKRSGMPIHNIIIYNEDTDVNNLLGKEGYYTSKVSFADDNLVQKNDDSPDGGTVEVFYNTEDCNKRFNYLANIYNKTTNRMHMFLLDNVLLRISYNVSRASALKYKDSIVSIVGNITEEKEYEKKRINTELENKEIANQFNSQTNRIIKIGQSTLEIPKEWKKEGDFLYCVERLDEHDVDCAYFACEHSNVSKGWEYVEKEYKQILAQLTDSGEKKLIDSGVTTLNNIPAICGTYESSYNGVLGREMLYVFPESENGVVLLLFFESNGCSMSHRQDFEKVLSSIKVNDSKSMSDEQRSDLVELSESTQNTFSHAETEITNNSEIDEKISDTKTSVDENNTKQTDDITVLSYELVNKDVAEPELKVNQYSYMIDKWTLYIATFLSESTVKIEKWKRYDASEDGDPFEYDCDVTIKSVEDGRRGFSWLDDQHTAFMVSFIDKGNGYDNKSVRAFFSQNGKKNSADYSFLHDKWNLYLGYNLSESVIKIERWGRNEAGEYGDPFKHEADYIVIDTLNPRNEFCWLNNDHLAFSIKVQDKDNYYWKQASTAVFTTPLRVGTPIYTYMRDKWNLYKAYLITEELIKIEKWTRLDASEYGDSFAYAYDVDVIQIENQNSEFKWIDASKAGFKLTMKDDEDNSWKVKERVNFAISEEKVENRDNESASVPSNATLIEKGDYLVGVDIDPGSYLFFMNKVGSGAIVAVFSSTSNMQKYTEWSSPEMLAQYGKYALNAKNERPFHLCLTKGDVLHISKGEGYFIPYDNSILSAGIYIVGKDFEEGTYRCTLDGMSNGIVAVFASSHDLVSYTSWDSYENLEKYSKSFQEVRKNEEFLLSVSEGEIIYVEQGFGVITKIEEKR